MMAMTLCPAGRARPLESHLGGFVCGDRVESALCTSRVLLQQRRHGECSALLGVRGHVFSSAGDVFSTRTARHVGQKAVLAAQDGSSTQVDSSTQVEEDKMEQTWDTAGGPNTPMVPTNQLVSLQIPKPLSITDLALPPRHGSDLRVAYQGVPGAYSEAAAAKAYPRCEAVPCEQFEAAFQAVELWLVDRAVLPIENSLGGSIHRNYDLLLRHRLHIVGEVQLAVHHCLLGIPGVKKEELLRVVSHPQALAQCENTLSKLGVAREAVDDTAGAAQFIAAHDLRDTGAVASARAAEIYGLEILMDGIQDDLDNVTRFLMLAREPIIPRIDRPFKTSIVFTLEEGPGVLFKALAVFALRNINLTKIESRPQRKRPLRVVDDSNNGSAKCVHILSIAHCDEFSL
ncbi:hypothetical protein KC19_2G007600 [Ceratodon purpureus]|uniref:Arogenate dehydratase n=1 Tax=Ceratodon purpureus TaxID=3225 RepID=A0A8T0IQR6_CERPU|nr:hypothetical protein KC19_2G007600 [Ceratodon purpureus]